MEVIILFNELLFLLFLFNELFYLMNGDLGGFCKSSDF